jgi:DNA mismatch repair protein MutH
MPIESARHIPLGERRIGSGVLWQPTGQLLAELQQDYEEHMERIILGEVDSIHAEQGKWLQIRPKAANSKALTDAIGPEGKRIKTLPRGFYLRPALTRQILAGQSV